MDEKPKRGRPRKEDAVLPVKFLVGYWPESGGKCIKGDEVDLPASEARMVVSAGIAVRNDRF